MTEMATIKVIITGEATLEEDLDNPQWSHPALAFCSQMLLNLAQQTARPIPCLDTSQYLRQIHIAFYDKYIL